MANNMEVGKHGRVDQYGNPIVVNSEYAGKHQAETIPSDDPWKEWRNLEANPPKFAGDTLEEQEAPVEQPATTIQVDKDNFGLSEGFKDTLVKVPNKEIPKTDGEVNEDDLATGPEPETTSPSESTAEITEPVPQEELVTENN